jgi:transcriptional regulator of aromatic amino acid metabolism
MSDLFAAEFPWCVEPLLLRSATLGGIRPNFLVNCTSSELESVTGELLKWCGPSVRLCSMPGWLDLPSNYEGTLILTRVEDMSMDQQIALFDWMTTAHATVQVVSVATGRIDQLVRDGRFLEGLFYRLNVIRLDARSTGQVSHHPVDPTSLVCHAYGQP